MPVLHKYRDKNGYYILTSINKTIVTFQLTYRGGEFSIWRYTSQQMRVRTDISANKVVASDVSTAGYMAWKAVDPHLMRVNLSLVM